MALTYWIARKYPKLNGIIQYAKAKHLAKLALENRPSVGAECAYLDSTANFVKFDLDEFTSEK